MKNLPLYNDSDIGYMDEEFLHLEDVNPVEKNINEKKLQSGEPDNEEESKKI